MTERCRGFMSDVTHDISGIYDSAAVRIIIRHVSREINRVNDREVAMRLLAERDIRPATVEKVLFRDKRRKESVGNRLTWCRLLAETCDGRPDTPRLHVRPDRPLAGVRLVHDRPTRVRRRCPVRLADHSASRHLRRGPPTDARRFRPHTSTRRRDHRHNYTETYVRDVILDGI